MDNQLFAEGYPRQRNYSELDEDPEVTRLLEVPRFWTSFFDTQLSQYLQGEQPADTSGIEDELHYEFTWSSRNLDKTRAKIANLALKDERNLQHLNALNFLSMTEPLTAFWTNVLAHKNYYFSPEYLSDTQTLLAMKAATLARERKQAVHTYGQKSETVGVIDGQLTEIDTMVIMIEMMKNEVAETGKTTRIALPAPARFEANRIRSRNADLLFIDTELHQIRGVQAKTYTSNRLPGTTNYNHDFVTVIDGSTDLGNSTGFYKLNEHGGSSFVMKSLPGLISMDHLQRTSIKDVPHGHTRSYGHDLMVAKSIARELSGTRKSYIAHATAHVSERLLNDLYDGNEQAS